MTEVTCARCEKCGEWLHVSCSPSHRCADTEEAAGGLDMFASNLVLGAPSRWYAKESLTLFSPDGQANVIFSSEPLSPSVDTNRYAAAQGELLADEFPGFQPISFRQFEVRDGRRALLRDFTWVPPDGEVVRQLQIYFVERSRGYAGTATAPVSEFDRFEGIFQRIFQTLGIVLQAHMGDPA